MDIESDSVRSSPISPWLSAAQIFTSGAGILFGLFTALQWAIDLSGRSWVQTLDSALLVAVIVGGVVMGLLWAARWLTTRRSGLA